MSFVGTAFLSKRHDTKPFFDRLEREQTPGAGDFAPINLSGATVKFLCGDGDGNPIFSGAATILTPSLPTDPNVKYQPTGPQMAFTTNTNDQFPLTLRVEWEITYGDGTIETIPAGKDYLRLIVGLDLETA